MWLGPLLDHYALAAAIADGQIAGVGESWVALLGHDPTGDAPSALGLGGALATALTGTTIDAHVGPARVRVRTPHASFDVLRPVRQSEPKQGLQP